MHGPKQRTEKTADARGRGTDGPFARKESEDG